MDRRDFLWTVGSMSSMALLGGVSFAVGDKKVAVPAKNAQLSVAWLPKGDTSYTLFKKMIEKSTDFSWLKNGDKVLIKLALNSGNPNPATSRPLVAGLFTQGIERTRCDQDLCRRPVRRSQRVLDGAGTGERYFASFRPIFRASASYRKERRDSDFLRGARLLAVIVPLFAGTKVTV